eukprot:g1763.t1
MAIPVSGSVTLNGCQAVVVLDVAATFQVTERGLFFNGGGAAKGLFRRAAYVSMLTRRLNLDAQASSQKSKAQEQSESWDCSTDHDGWCRMSISTNKSLCVAPPKALGFEQSLPVELSCFDLPKEVIFPQKGRSGRRRSSLLGNSLA